MRNEEASEVFLKKVCTGLLFGKICNRQEEFLNLWTMFFLTKYVEDKHELFWKSEGRFRKNLHTLSNMR